MDRLSAIEVFVRVVDTGSFSAVARLQNIGQPAVSKAVVQLEEWLGVSLLMRSTRSETPTEAGRIFYERAKRMTAEASAAVIAARGKASGLSGKLRVSTAICFGRLHLIPNLWVANWQLWHKSPLWCSLAQIGRVSRRDCTSGFSQNSA